MNPNENIANDLHIPASCTRHVRGAQYACLVHQKWLKSICTGSYVAVADGDYDNITDLDPGHLLAQSTTKLPEGWTRVTIQVLHKSDTLVHSLVESTLSIGSTLATHCEILQHAAVSIHKGLWRQASKSYSHAIWPTKPEQHQLTIKMQSQITRDVLKKLFRCHIIPVSDGVSQQPLIFNPYHGHIVTDCPHPAILRPHVVLETESAFYLVFPFEQFTLWNCVLFSPAKLTECSVKSLFVFYQILHCVQHCHSLGISLGNIHLDDFYMDDRCWVKLFHPDLLMSVCLPSQPSLEASHQQATPQPEKPLSIVPDLPELVQAWVLGQLSNFDYLMALNHLAGRRMCDPNHHPILPWVTDFKSLNSGFRDLTKSKYRLNKGDGQLDITYNPADPLKDPLHVPHHIAEVLSDITYYVYKARQIPKSVLTTHVRQRWVPNEYPSSMERLQQWTPDECIPEFFTDPSIFHSIHDDLPDLEIPHWASDPNDFIRKHRELLESDYVSQRLHHWIDLTFGYKLSGQSAVKAKNICLQLVDQHTNLLNYGVVQLFNHPHPPRVDSAQATRLLAQSKDSFKTKPLVSTQVEASVEHKEVSGVTTNDIRGLSETMINLPTGFQPVLALNHVEALYEFCQGVAGKLPPAPSVKNEPDVSIKEELVARDMQALGCILVELFLSRNTRALGYGATLQQRYLLARSVCNIYWHDLPRAVQEAVRLLLQLQKPWSPNEVTQHGALFLYEPVSDQGLPPPVIDHLLHLTYSPIKFPVYFKSLYIVLYKLHVLEQQAHFIEASGLDAIEKQHTLKRLSKQQVSILGHYLYKAGRQLRGDGLTILLPYVSALMENPVTLVDAAWCLFNPTAQAMSHDDTEKHLMGLLQKLFDMEETTPKFIKIYHRTFVLQLITRFGLESFLNNMVTFLIEAVGGYKNFIEKDVNRESTQESQETNDKIQAEKIQNDKAQDQLSQEQRSMDSVADAMAYSYEEVVDENESETSDMLDDVFDNNMLLGDYKNDDGNDGVSMESSSTVHESDGEDKAEVGIELDGNADATSLSSSDVNEDALSKSVGRLSVHSVSRLMTSDGEDRSASEGEDELTSDVRDNSDVNTSDTHQVQPEMHGTASSVSSSMVHSETEDFSAILSDEHNFNISNVASETVKWLAHRLGPVLTAKYLSRNLLRMLMLCYIGKEQLQKIDREGDVISAGDHHLVGDIHAAEVLECLSFIVVLYGEQVVLLQYFQHARELIQSAVKKLTMRAEAGLISCVSLLVHIVPYLSDSTLLGVLQDVIFGDIVLQIMKLVSSTFISFPSGSLSRSAICYKLVDVLYIISLRIGFEMTREHMTYVLQKFFAAFNRIYEDPNKASCPTSSETTSSKSGAEESDDVSEDDTSLYCEVKLDTSTNEYCIGAPVPNNIQKHRRQGSLQRILSPTAQDDTDDVFPEKTKELILHELRETFTPELAHTAYIPFCKLAGGIYLEQNLINEDLIRNLCMIHDQTLSRQHEQHLPVINTSEQRDPKSPTEDKNVVSGSFGRNVSFSGNKIVIQEDALSSGTNFLDPTRGSQAARRRSTEITDDKLRNYDMKFHTERHLKGNWLAYWEHEVGLSDRENSFILKQIKLQSFVGHTSSVRAIHVLNNENSFVTASKDKTVKLWSLRNAGDGSDSESAKWTYKGHKKSVFCVSFMEATHHIVSCDTNIHIWDPFMERVVAIMDSPKNNPIIAMATMPTPSTTILAAGSDSILKFLDSRTGRCTHDLKCTTSPAGSVRCVDVSDNGWTAVIGFSSGIISTLDIRTGSLLASWKGHESEILQAKFHHNKLVTSCFDQTVCVWNTNGDRICYLKGPTEPVHCLNFYRDSLLSATTANKIGVHSTLDKNSSYTPSKLRSDVFRGVLTTMSLLPLNKLLLLGADNGDIRLVA